jgi:hypothetical protein
MNVGAQIKDVLDGLVSGRVYASTFPQEPNAPTWPAIRFTIITSTVFADQCGSDDEASDDVQVQIDVVAQTFDAMRALRLRVIDAMKDTDTPAVRQSGGFETFDSTTKTHRAVLDYVFQPSSSEDSPA